MSKLTEMEGTGTGTHPFEKAGLGKAPFRYAGMVEKYCTGQPGPDGFTIIGYAGQPAGCCDYCGQGIRYCCQIKSADGKTFEVGMDCVLKLDRADAALVAVVETEQKKIERARRQAARERKTAREAKRIAAAFELYDATPAIREALAAKPHPVIEGSTKAAYVDWMRCRGGHSGQLRAAAAIEAANVALGNGVLVY